MKKNFLILCLSLLLCFLSHGGNAGFNRSEGGQAYDILIKNGQILDGSLDAPFAADVAILGDTIIKIGKSIEGKAKKVIDAGRFFVTPGFIDLHNHAEFSLYFPENRACQNYLAQGVTTLVAGQCGNSGWPIFEKPEEAMKSLEEGGIGPNVALLVGHGTIREAVLGMENRDPTPEELALMKSLVKEAMEAGASGLSTGLVYLPGIFAKTNEIVELAKVIAPYGGIYHTHIRDEREKLLEAVQEAIEISGKAGVPVHISHLKVMGRQNWGLVKRACSLIEDARAKGLQATADQYPFPFSMVDPYVSPVPVATWLGKDSGGFTSEDMEKILGNMRDADVIEIYKKNTASVPLSASHEQFLKSLPRKRLGSFVARSMTFLENIHGPQNPRERMLFLRRLSDPKEAQKIRSEVRTFIDSLCGADRYFVAICVEKNLEGKSLAQAAGLKGKSIEDTAIELALMDAKCVPYQMTEDDIDFVLKKNYVGTGSDGLIPFYGIGLPHIRHYSTFLYKIDRYAIQRKIAPLPFIVRSQTSLPAQIMNWKDRGWIKEGYKADVVVLDIKGIKTPASLSNPHQYSQGVKDLVINGKMVLENGRWNGSLPGRVLRLKKS